MSHSFTYRTAARVIREVRPGHPADRALRELFAMGRPLPPAERASITAATFAYFRWNRWLDPKTKLEDRVARAVGLQRGFDSGGSISGDTRPFTLAVPDWVLGEINFGDGAEGEARRESWASSLQRPPPLWIRARPNDASSVSASLGNCSAPSASLPVPCRDALRYEGSADLFLTPQFSNGAFEIQDIGSQAVGVVCDPKPGETWWDACSGEGGKSLHLADLMANKGLLWCSDRSKRRATVLKRRFARAKLFNYRHASWDGTERLPTRTKFDGILLDAPCSGIGTWGRNPDARWTTRPGDIVELAAVQRRMLESVVGSLKPGGRLIYAVCTLARRETIDVASAFSAAHPELEPTSSIPSPDSDLRPSMLLWPQDIDGNGMFIAAWRRKQ